MLKQCPILSLSGGGEIEISVAERQCGTQRCLSVPYVTVCSTSGWCLDKNVTKMKVFLNVNLKCCVEVIDGLLRSMTSRNKHSEH